MKKVIIGAALAGMPVIIVQSSWDKLFQALSTVLRKEYTKAALRLLCSGRAGRVALFSEKLRSPFERSDVLEMGPN